MISVLRAPIPVRVDPMFLVVGTALGVWWPHGVVVFLTVLVVGVLWHEAAHVLAFRAFGYDVGIDLTAWGGRTWARGGEPLTPARRLVTSLAGPVASLGLGLGTYVVVLLAAGTGVLVPSALGPVVGSTVMLNVGWGLFNLLPVRPLDGGEALHGLLGLMVPASADALSRVVGTLLAAAALVSGLLVGSTWLAVAGGYLLLGNARPMWEAVLRRRHREALAALAASWASEDWPAAWEITRGLPREVVDDGIPGALSARLYDAGHLEAARDASRLAHGWRGRALDAFNVACCEARLGDTEAARRWLSTAIDGGLDDLALLDDDPDLASLRGAPGWETLRARVAGAADDPWRPPSA